jgi:hypothetical protein
MAKKGERKEKKISNWEKIVESKISFLLIGIVIGMFIVLVVSLLYMTTLSIIKETTHTIIQYQTVYRPTTEYLEKSITYTKIITTTVTMPITIVQTALKTETLPGTTIQTLTPYEKLEITSAYTEWDYINNAWKITLIGKNNGLIDITIAEITLNGKTINVNSNEKTEYLINSLSKLSEENRIFSTLEKYIFEAAVRLLVLDLKKLNESVDDNKMELEILDSYFHAFFEYLCGNDEKFKENIEETKRKILKVSYSIDFERFKKNIPKEGRD